MHASCSSYMTDFIFILLMKNNLKSLNTLDVYD